MNLSDDEKRLLKNYRTVKAECQGFQPSSFSMPACSFGAGKGAYLLTLNGDFVKED
jgi:hypothetical protein